MLTQAIAADALGFLALARVRGHSPTTLHAATNGRGRDNHNALFVRSWRVPSALHSELDLPVLHRRVRGADCGRGGCTAGGTVLGFLLYLLDEVSNVISFMSVR